MEPFEHDRVAPERKKILALESEVRDLKLKLKEHSKLEAQLFQAQKMEALGCLAGGIAHDFNNILQSILGYTQLAMLNKSGEGGADAQVLKQIENIITKGSELTEQFLTFGRKVELKFIPLDLNTTLKEIQKLLRRTIPRMIEIELALAEDLKLINADASQCEQVLMNLCINARHAMQDNGKLTLKTENVVLKTRQTHLNIPPGEYVVLTVADTGTGIAAETLRHMYEPFFTTKERGKGTGLGLSIVYSIIKNHSGFIDCSSEVGKGTAFKIYFPVLKRTTIAPSKRDCHKREDIAKGNETILFVDDETDFLKVGKRILRKYGYTVFTADSGEKAIQLFTHTPIDLVLLDISMPGMGGLQCLRKLADIDDKAKILIISGYSMNGRIQEALSLGGAAFLAKPYRIDRLLSVVRKLLDGTLDDNNHTRKTHSLS